jgi:hypothetical protein
VRDLLGCLARSLACLAAAAAERAEPAPPAAQRAGAPAVRGVGAGVEEARRARSLGLALRLGARLVPGLARLLLSPLPARPVEAGDER